MDRPLDYRKALIGLMQNEANAVASSVTEAGIKRNAEINDLISSKTTDVSLSNDNLSIHGFASFDFDKSFVWGKSVWGVHKIGYPTETTTGTERTGFTGRY
jgi:hypothetical protein